MSMTSEETSDAHNCNESKSNGSNGSNGSMNPDKDRIPINPNEKMDRAIADSRDDVVKKDANPSEKEEYEIKIIVALVIVILITVLGYPPPIGSEGPILHHVFYYGWLTAISTGLGVVPLIFIPDLDSFWVGVSNAIAAGMMTAASYSLLYEGCNFQEPTDTSEFSSTTRTLFGAALGLIFILSTKQFLESHEDVKVLEGPDTRKVLLIVLVMTLHSFSEGIGIGVSFGGEHGSSLGVFISASLAVHNIPEGLAVAIVLLPKKVSKLNASLWCMVTSLPQPLMAVPAFLFVHKFIPILPAGLGFAGGAMAFVAMFELLTEAYEDTNALITGTVSALSLAFMLYIQDILQT